MAYNINFIDPRDFLKDSQSGLLENFAQIEAFIAQDHETFGAANEGKHKQLTMPQVAADTLAAGTDWLLFADLSANTKILSSLLRAPDGTFGGLTEANIAVNQIDKWVKLPSGIVIKWANVDIDIETNPATYVWGTAPITRPFNNQYWAIVIPSTFNLAGVDSGAVIYVTDVSDPLQIEFRMWIRDRFSIAAIGRVRVLIIAIGD